MIQFPFQLKSARAIDPDFAEIDGNKFFYKKELTGKDRVTAGLQGFGTSADDYDFRVENKKAGAGVRIRGDRPITSIALWSIRTVMAVEPYIAMQIAPQDDFTWKLTYDYYAFDAHK